MKPKKGANITFTLTTGIILLWLLSPICSFSQTLDIGLPFIKNYYPSEYKAHVQNFDIVQDTRGIMYFANFRGILEFDGQNWRTIQTTKISQVTALAIDSTGIIYVGGAGEIGFLYPDFKGELIFKSLVDSLTTEERRFQTIIKVLATKEGIYFVSDSSILLWNGSSFKTVKAEGSINFAFFIDNKLYFYEKGKGLQYLLNNQKYKIETETKLSEAVVIKGMLSLGSDKVLLATGSIGLMLLENNILTAFHTSDDEFLRQNNISCAISLKDGSLALGTERGGVAIFYPDGTLKQKIEQGIQNDYVRALFSDKNNTLWLALDNGISRMEIPSYLTFFDEKTGVAGVVNQVLRNNNKIYFASNKGLYHYDEKAEKYVLIPGINSACWSILADNNSIIAATSKGVFLVTDQSADLISPDFSFKIFRSQKDNSNIYVGQLGGIALLQNKNGKWISKGKVQGITDEISEIQEDNNGILWAAIATRGLVKVNPFGTQQSVIYDDTKGLPSRFGNHLNKIGNSLYVTTQNGMFVYNENSDLFSQLKTLRNDTLLPKEWISTIVEDPNGNLWTINGDETHIRLRKTDTIEESLNQVLLKPIQDRTILNIYPEKDGKVWFCGTDGVICYDPKIQKNLNFVPRVLFRSVTASDSLLFDGTFLNDNNRITTVQPPRSIPNLNYSSNTLAFKLANPSFNMFETVEFQYFLKGFDTDTSAWVSDIQKEYTNLPAGEYTFSVRARNIYGKCTDPSTFTFYIKKPFYQTIFAYVLYFLFFAIVLYILVRLRSQQLVKEKKKLENLIIERTAEVVSQKEEIEKQSVELSNKNDELEKINLIVKSINSEIHFSSLLQSLLEKTKVIGGVEKATMMVHEKSTDLFLFKAGFGWDFSVVSDIRMTLSDVEEFYLHNANEVYEDIFEIRKFSSDSGPEILRRMVNPKSMVIMIVRVNDGVEGFLMLENSYKNNAFNQQDFSLLQNLKEHIISAFIKTIILEDLETTLINLKETQEQLIQQEKMASIGQLTKGIVDRILNPLNYINNFSLLTNDLSGEMEEILDGLKEIMDIDTYEELKDLLKMVKMNVLKVNEHGASASRIVKGMEKLLKERSTTFVLTDLNTLVDSHIEIALQEYQAENKSFKVEIVKDLDFNSKKIKILPSELGSVIVNTVDNAFYAVDEKMKKVKDFEPLIRISTQFSETEAVIIIRDNGNGIPEQEQKKMFQPFQTTKPTSKGTGLSLYMNLDIIKSHKGTIDVESKDGEFTSFVIRIPRTAEG